MPHILLATTGESPQVVTETLYAIHTEGLEWPDEIFLITTTLGRARAEAGLIEAGHLERLCAEIGRKKPSFDRKHIEVVPNARGQEVDDARSLEDHEALADFIMTRVRDLTADDRKTVHASLAGGRKTMTFYLGYAMSLFGRRADRLTHVLVNEKCYESSNFWFPTISPEHRFFKDWNGNFILNKHGQPAEATPEYAQVTLADIPFIRQRHNLPKVLSKKSDKVHFREIVALINLGEQPDNVLLTLRPTEQKVIIESLAKELTIKPIEITLGKLEMAHYTAIARAKSVGLAITRPAEDECNADLLKLVLDELMRIVGLEPEQRPIDALDALEAWSDEEIKDPLDSKTLLALRGERSMRDLGITQGWFDDRRSALLKRFEQQLPKNLVEQVLPSRTNKYATALEAENIRILNEPLETQETVSP